MTTAREKLLAVLTTVPAFGIDLHEAARRSGISLSSVRRVIEQDDGTIAISAGSYRMGRSLYQLHATDRLSIRSRRG